MSKPTGSALVEWAGVALSYPGSVPVHAVKATDLTIERGEYVAIVGPSGAGKSSLLNLLGLLDQPTGGQQWFDGVDVSTISEAERSSIRASSLSFIFQAFHLLNERTVFENIALGLLYHPTIAGDQEKLVSVAAEQVGLSHRVNALASTLSGGERQRTAIARAMVRRPLLLLADEPTGNLDSGTSEEILNLFDDFQESQTTLVVVSHNPEVAERANRVLHLQDGYVSEFSRPSLKK